MFPVLGPSGLNSLPQLVSIAVILSVLIGNFAFFVKFWVLYSSPPFLRSTYRMDNLNKLLIVGYLIMFVLAFWIGIGSSCKYVPES